MFARCLHTTVIQIDIKTIGNMLLKSSTETVYLRLPVFTFLRPYGPVATEAKLQICTLSLNPLTQGVNYSTLWVRVSEFGSTEIWIYYSIVFPEAILFLFHAQQIIPDTFRGPLALSLIGLIFTCNETRSLCLVDFWKGKRIAFILFTGIDSWHKYSPVSIFHVFSNICRMWKVQKQTRCCKKVVTLRNIIITISYSIFFGPSSVFIH